jgi:hypothetical protein
MSAGGLVQLCLTEPQPAIVYPSGQEPPFSCSAIAITLDRFDPASASSWTERQGVGFTSTQVLVSGIWRDGFIDVLDVADAPPASTESPTALPCPAPQGGWLIDEDFASPREREAALARLAALVDGSPDVYSGRWAASPNGVANAPQVHVVGTVEDPAIITPLVRETFPGNLCVYHVDYSTSRLQQIAQRLVKGAPASQVNIRPDLDMVEWQLVAVDDRAAAALAGDRSAVVLKPMVVPR